MALTSAQAVQFTNQSIAITNTQDLQTEVSLAESQIRNAAGRRLFETAYNANIVGNPVDDPTNDDNLTPIQIEFRDAFQNAGFILGRDEDNGFWTISWEAQGPEALVNVYSLRTTLVPGAIETATVDVINTYFASLTPRVLSTAQAVSINGGDIIETEFGATDSVSYEYIIVTTQPDTSTDYSTGLKSALIASGLGYDDTGSDNMEVYKLK